MESNPYLQSPLRLSSGWSDHDDFRAADVEMVDFPISTQLGSSSAVQIPDSLVTNAEGQQDAGPPGPPPTSRRSKYRDLDWEHHKPQLKKIYLDENKSLSETIAIMRDQHSFKASVKVYKERFKQWEWSKNLPAEVAGFMVEKSKRRKRENGSDTVFTYGGKQWDKTRAENTLTRSKKPRTQDAAAIGQTPDGVTYKTPVDAASSSGDGESSEDSQSDELGENEPTTDNSDGGLTISLEWKGLGRSRLVPMWEEARGYVRQGKPKAAEPLLKQVVEGLAHLNGRTNEHTKKASFELANLYAQMSSKHEADKVLEQVMQAHVDIWGPRDRKTHQCILHTVELLNSWNRPEDALALASQSEEMVQSKSRHSRRNRKRNRRKNREKSTEFPVNSTQHLDANSAVDSVPQDFNAANIDHHLDAATSRVIAKDPVGESLLLALIRHFEKNPRQLHVQHLKARGELLRLYEDLHLVQTHDTTFKETPDAINTIWNSYAWSEEKYESIDVIEAYMQVVANMLKSGYTSIALPVFRKVADRAESLFGYGDERAIWVSITIGLAYQTHRTWLDAEEWFQRAYSQALHNDWGPKDGIVRSLGDALEKHWFSYLNDEGRPFKSVFGVLGVTIRPNRLHLE
ncbi:hypothetical protein B0T10DRAFT_587446 [Thelonectria olida]|uniref:Clr5 domain-containing protein n=1 Tax=Thelonectria olida TaxID=1576542 RepID=A0A9P8WCA3_9HYPO|nr:hypothetical protein B0T10DRAFT_587446 [Thelonectria olida]